MPIPSDQAHPDPTIIPVKNLLTNSRQKAFRACPRYEQIKYRLMYEAVKKSKPLAFGTQTHLGLETYWKEIKKKNFERATDAALDIVNKKPLEDPFEQARLNVMIGVYGEYWLEFAKTVEVLFIEEQFRAPLVHPDDTRFVARTWERAGKLDGLIRLKDGRVAVLEHKTTSSDMEPGSNYRGQLAMDSQISMYFHGSLALGHACDLCIYDILKKPRAERFLATPEDQRKTKKDGSLYSKQRDRDETLEEYETRILGMFTEDPNKYLRHVEVSRTRQELARDARDTWHIVRTMYDAQQAGYFHRNPDACFRFGKACEYIGVCQGVESLENPLKFAKATEAHPELREEEASLAEESE